LSFDLREKVIFYCCLVVAVILHEMSHGVVALVYGDDTAKRAGRLTLNPIPHIDPVGSVLLPIMAVLASLPVIGWAKPVPVNPSKLRDPRRQMLLVGLAGPLTNFTLMLVAAAGARMVLNSGSYSGRSLPAEILVDFAFVNLFLGLFNLLPIPPLDGSSIIERVLPREALPAWHKFRPYGFLVLFVLVFYFNFFGRLVDPFLNLLVEFIRA
jgi:Zn-dependent protease